MGGRAQAGVRVQGSADSWAGRLRRHRRGAAATASALAVLCLGLGLRPPSPAMRDVVVAARDLPTGHRLGVDDLSIAQVPASIMPAGTTADPAALTGCVLAAPLVAGEPIASARLAGSLAGRAAPAGSVPMPVRFSDAAAVGLLSPGQVVDILAARAAAADDPVGGGYPAPAQVLAPGALVLAVTGPEPTDRGLTDPAGVSGAPLVVVALTPGQARAVAGAEATTRLSFTLGPAGS